MQTRRCPAQRGRVGTRTVPCHTAPGGPQARDQESEKTRQEPPRRGSGCEEDVRPSSCAHAPPRKVGVTGVGRQEGRAERPSPHVSTGVPTPGLRGVGWGGRESPPRSRCFRLTKPNEPLHGSSTLPRSLHGSWLQRPNARIK